MGLQTYATSLSDGLKFGNRLIVKNIFNR